MAFKTSKSTANTKRISIIIGIIVVIGLVVILIFTVFKNTSPIYLPYQEKEKIVQIKENNNEARIYIYINQNQSENMDVQVYNENELNEPLIVSIDKSKKRTEYIYTAFKEEQYTVKIKNKTNSVLFSNVKVQANN